MKDTEREEVAAGRDTFRVLAPSVEVWIRTADERARAREEYRRKEEEAHKARVRLSDYRLWFYECMDPACVDEWRGRITRHPFSVHRQVNRTIANDDQQCGEDDGTCLDDYWPPLKCQCEGFKRRAPLVVIDAR